MLQKINRYLQSLAFRVTLFQTSLSASYSNETGEELNITYNSRGEFCKCTLKQWDTELSVWNGFEVEDLDGLAHLLETNKIVKMNFPNLVKMIPFVTTV